MTTPLIEGVDEELAASTVGDAGSESVHRFVVATAGERLDRLLQGWMGELSRSRLTLLVDEGRVTVDGQVAKPSQRPRAGQEVVLSLPPPVPVAPQPQELPISVLYEDSDLLVLDKAAGMVVHPAAGAPDGTLVNALLFHVRDLGGVGGELRPGIVHRLDKETSGAIVVAKHDVALARLQRAFHDRQVDKRYVAIAHGHTPLETTYDTPFGRHPVDRVRMTGRLRADDPQARRAVTHVRTAETLLGGEASFVEISLETGRTHQIRVHLSEAGHPLLGDATYGGTKRDARAHPRVRQAAAMIGRQALHAHVLTFPHPRDGRIVSCTAPLPASFTEALALLSDGR